MIFEEKFFPIETYNLGIDSGFRDKNKYPNSYDYVVIFDNIFKNVVSVQLVFAVYENSGTDKYVNLHIDELSPNLISNSQYISGSFCQLPTLQAKNVYDTSMYKCIKTFEKPLSKLSRMTIRFINSNGDIYPMRDHFLKFEIQCLKFSGKVKEWKNNELFTQSVSMYEPSAASKQVSKPSTSYLNVPEKYDLEILKTAFKSACEQLRAQAYPKAVYNIKYNELKDEFRKYAQMGNLVTP